MTALQTARIVQPHRVVVIRCSAWFASGVGLFFQVTLKLSQNSKVRSPNKGDVDEIYESWSADSIFWIALMTADPHTPTCLAISAIGIPNSW